jgi:hypothetical protein
MARMNVPEADEGKLAAANPRALTLPSPAERERGKKHQSARSASQLWIAGGTSRCARPET